MKTIHFLFYDPCIINGGFYDNFEYYYILKKNLPDVNIKYIIISSHFKEDVIKLINDKYDDIDDFYIKDIECIDYGTCPKIHKNPFYVDILICGTNTSLYYFLERGHLKLAKFYIGLADTDEINRKQLKLYKNGIILGDERVFRFDNIRWKPYRKKILFDKYKRKEFVSRYDYMLNLSLSQRRFTKEFITRLTEKFPGSHVAYTGVKNIKYYSWLETESNIKLIVPPVKNFMDLFECFIYVPYEGGVDATPRLIPECKFYNKKLEFYTEWSEIKSGGYYRYKDTQDNFNGLFLKDDDEFISHTKEILSNV